MESLVNNMDSLLRRPEKREDIRITSYLEPELFDIVMNLKKNGISIKKFLNEAVADLLKKYDLI